MLDTTTKRRTSVSFLDAVEKYVMATVYIFFAYRMINGYRETGSPITLIYMADQFAVLLFILFRRSTQDLSQKLNDWIVGFAGTFFALLIAAPTGTALVPTYVVSLMLLVGFAIHVSAKLSLRRSFGVVAANRGIKQHGIYRWVRHPMYLGYMVSQLALLLAGLLPYNIVIIGGCWLLFIKRIQAEERLLSQDPAYREFALQTPYRIVPGVY